MIKKNIVNTLLLCIGLLTIAPHNASGMKKPDDGKLSARYKRKLENKIRLYDEAIHTQEEAIRTGKDSKSHKTLSPQGIENTQAFISELKNERSLTTYMLDLLNKGSYTLKSKGYVKFCCALNFLKKYKTKTWLWSKRHPKTAIAIGVLGAITIGELACLAITGHFWIPFWGLTGLGTVKPPHVPKLGEPGYVAPKPPHVPGPGEPGYVAPKPPHVPGPGEPGYVAPHVPGPGEPGYVAPGVPDEGYIEGARSVWHAIWHHAGNIPAGVRGLLGRGAPQDGAQQDNDL